MEYKLPPLPEPKDEVADIDGFVVKGMIPVYTAEQMQAYAIAAIEAQGVPEGWQLVPKEPTPKMLAAIAKTQAERKMGNGYRVEWFSWLASAPPAPQKLPRKIPIPPEQAEMLDVVYAEGWNQCCDTFFGGLPPQEPVVITITERDEAPAPQAERKPLFADLIANHEGLSEELKAIDAQVDKEHGQASVVQQEPRAWLRKWAHDGVKPKKEKNTSGRWAWPGKFKLMPVTEGKCLPDDVPLYTHPAQQAKPQPLSDEQIEKGRQATFSTNNPFCPCDSKTMRKAVRWAEAAHGIQGS